ncbi:MAG: response regulator transcription factor [Nocardioidaceae bacterium]
MGLLLDHRKQSAVHGLLMAEPEPGVLLPSPAVESLRRLIGWDAFGVGEADRTGCLLRVNTFPYVDPRDPQVCDGPLPTGLQHDAAMPPDERDAAYEGLRDQIRLGWSTGSGTVIQLWFERWQHYFVEQDIAVLTMLEPALERLVRSCAGEPGGGSLSASERRVLTLVARGCSNREVAEELYVTVHTVRKHLEHAYRKLGVTNRTAAALRLRSIA